MDENQVVIDIIEKLKAKFSEDRALIQSFPDNPNYDDGVLDYTMTHPMCEILVDCDNIDFGAATLSDQQGTVGIEITIFTRTMTGFDGARKVCQEVRQVLTGNIFEGGRPMPGEQRKLYYNGEGSIWCYGQHYSLETIFPLGYEEE